MDNAELTFPFNSLTEFTDWKRVKRPWSRRRRSAVYMAELAAILTAYERAVRIRADYKLFSTSRPLDLALSEYLYRRSQIV